ncbi:MAG: hypothetical protein U9N07_08955 [Euryarchaeota archaeon]|nr:hypothetical protein [Euryarchaeota archaeon]
MVYDHGITVRAVGDEQPEHSWSGSEVGSSMQGRGAGWVCDWGGLGGGRFGGWGDGKIGVEITQFI